MADPIVRLAKLRIIKVSAELEAELRGITNSSPSLEILRRLRERAADSLAALALVDAEDTKAIRTLQNEVKRYDEWLTWLRDIISEGITFDAEISADEREEMIDLLVETPEGQREAALLGLVDLNQQQDG